MFNYRTKWPTVEIFPRTLIGSVLVIFLSVGIVTGQGLNHALRVIVNQTDGSYTIGAPGLDASVLHAGMAVELDGHWVESASYPKHFIVKSTVPDDLGIANEWTVRFSGLTGKPDLIYHLRAYPDKPFGDFQVIVRNGTSKPIHVESIRVIAAMGNSILNLGGPGSFFQLLDLSPQNSSPQKIAGIQEIDRCLAEF